MKGWKVVVDMSPATVQGTNGCHEYVFGWYKTKREAKQIADAFNLVTGSEKARVEKHG